MIRNLLLWLILISPASFADTTTLQPWRTHSLSELKEHYQQQPFLLVFWSLECPACYDEFEALKIWTQRYPKSNLVIVSTDSQDLQKEVIDVLNEYRLETNSLWIFSNEPRAKLRQAIDDSWFGELPRSYFFNTQHQAHSHSGALTGEQLEKWQYFISTQKTPTKTEH